MFISETAGISPVAWFNDDKSGNPYSGSGDYTYYDLDANPNPSISGTFTITAKRIVVQAPR